MSRHGEVVCELCNEYQFHYELRDGISYPTDRFRVLVGYSQSEPDIKYVCEECYDYIFCPRVPLPLNPITPDEWFKIRLYYFACDAKDPGHE